MWCVIPKINKSSVIAQAGSSGCCVAGAAPGLEGPGSWVSSVPLDISKRNAWELGCSWVELDIAAGTL